MRLINKAISFIHVSWLVICGFSYNSAKDYLKNKRRKGDNGDSPFSTRLIYSLLPFNGLYEHIFDDGLAFRLSFGKCSGFALKHYFYADKRNGKSVLCPLVDAFEKGYEQWPLIDVLKAIGRFEVFNYSDKSSKAVFDFSNGSIEKNGLIITIEEFNSYMDNVPKGCVVRERFNASDLINICVLNENGNDPEIIDEYGNTDLVTEAITDMVLGIASESPEIEYFNIQIGINNDECRIIDVETGKDLIQRSFFPNRLKQFIINKAHSKRFSLTVKRMPLTIKKYVQALVARKHGFLSYMYKNWKKGVNEDLKNSKHSRKEIKWAHKRGFYSYRFEQYGINEANYKDFLSDYDYKRLRPLNCKYGKLLENKITISHVMGSYTEFFPKYYYLILKRGNLKYIKTLDCPGDLSCDADGVVGLLEEKGELAMKPVIGSHGKGFMRIQSIDDKYTVNDAVMTRKELVELLDGIDRDYVVTEYVSLHDSFKSFYPNATGTIRMMVINESGSCPSIEDAYFRIGTSSTGNTDNLTSGGIYAKIGLDTGYFHDAVRVIDHALEKCEYHPDTNAKIEGTIPNWSALKEGIINISKGLSPLEYLGFDIVVTNDGFRVLEINTHQDLHRYPDYNDRIKAYLRGKLKEKDRSYYVLNL